MKQKPSSKRTRNSTKSILRLPDLEHAKAAVLNSLRSNDCTARDIWVGMDYGKPSAIR